MEFVIAQLPVRVLAIYLSSTLYHLLYPIEAKGKQYGS